MARALLIVLDSVGIGGAPDAERYGDAGSDTVGHIAEACAAGRGDRAGLRSGPLRLPHLAALGLGLAC
ncbi:phosphopentomutase, partial [Methylobacterium sp. WL6]